MFIPESSRDIGSQRQVMTRKFAWNSDPVFDTGFSNTAGSLCSDRLQWALWNSKQAQVQLSARLFTTSKASKAFRFLVLQVTARDKCQLSAAAKLQQQSL